MKKTILFLSLFLFFNFFNIHSTFSQAKTFDVVFVAGWWSVNDNWLDSIKNDWGATEVCLYINWSDVENIEDNFNFHVNDSIINMILSHGLKVSVRLVTAVSLPSWVTPGTYFNKNDFQIDHNSDYIELYGKKTLNFASQNSKDYMFRFFNKAARHFDSLFQEIEEIVPSLNPNAEMEYTYGNMGGYSTPEIEMFQNYLNVKYGNKNNLNNRWGSTYNNFNEVDPKSLDWHNIAWNVPITYQYQCGRADWMDFRTKLLKSFIDTCAIIIHNNHLKMGLQIGSFYDQAIEVRGWHDPTSLVENVDAVRHDDIIEYKQNFEFGADYVRSLCNYWTEQKKFDHTFSTEITWPDYPRNDNIIFPPAVLDAHYTEQLTKFYERGAQRVYLTQWDKDTINNVLCYFPLLNAKLKSLSDTTLATPNHSKAVHLSCEQGNFLGNPTYTTAGPVDDFTYYDFLFRKTIIPDSQYIKNTNNYDGNCDIVTNFMINNTPDYISAKYSNFYFTKSSYYIPDETYLKLMSSDVKVYMENATFFEDKNNDHWEFDVTHGIRNEYNDIRSPIHLIWRTRTDLQTIWPDANLPEFGSGWSQDFIYWCLYWGTGYSNSNLREYPEWNILEPCEKCPEESILGYYIYDNNIKKTWDQDENLQYFYPDAHHVKLGEDGAINMISWARENNNNLLANYNSWPYIGTISDRITSKTTYNTIPEKYSISQNYPNPFNPLTKINYNLPKNSKVTIVIFDILGREVTRLLNNEIKPAGRYSLEFNASNYTSGVYFYRIVAEGLNGNNFIDSKKMVLIK